MGILKNSKVNILLFSIVMIVILLSCSSQGQAAQSGDYTYTIIDGKVQITKYTGVGGDVTIPDSLGGIPVTSIGYRSFWNCSSLTSVTIPSNVTSLGTEAFNGCTSLTTATILGNVTNIGQVFNGCTNLTTVTILGNATSIGDNAFNGCTNLTSITLPSSLTSIGYRSFWNCSSLMSVTIPSNVTSIGIEAFSGACTSMTTVTFLGNATSIGASAFSGSSLKGVTIPDNAPISSSATSIGDNAFNGCTNLTNIILPSSLTSIGYRSFWDCSSLTSVTIPSNVTSLGTEAFNGCTSLTSIMFNSATTTINDSAGTIPVATKIIGYASSTAKTYAAKYNRTFQVIGAIKTLQSITITSPASKLSYTIGDSLDISGLVITGTYSDDSSKVESITDTNVTGFNSTAAVADQVLTITVDGKTTSYKVQIVSATGTGNTDTTGMTEMTTTSLTTVATTKEWTIKLSGLVKEPISSEKIYVTNSKGIKQSTSCTVTSNNGFSQIKIKPDNNYTPDSYTLWIRDIESTKGIKIKNQVYLKFTVQ